MESIVEHAKKAIIAEKAKDWKTATEHWQMAADACVTKTSSECYESCSSHCKRKLEASDA